MRFCLMLCLSAICVGQTTTKVDYPSQLKRVPFTPVETYGTTGAGNDCAAFQGAAASTALFIEASYLTSYYAPCTITLKSGQTWVFGPGTHQFNGFIIPDSSTVKTAGNVAINGQGSAVTTLKQIAGVTQDFIRSSSFYSLFDTGNKFGVNGYTLKGVTIDGNASNQTLTTKVITGVASTTPLSVTAVAHGYSSGDVVCQKNIGGKPEAEGCFVITVGGANTYTLNGTSSISTNAYTAGGLATNQHENGLALYGQGYVIEDVIVQNCKMNGILSGWDVEPTGGYVNVLDRTSAHLAGIRSNLNGFDGIRWHGPHDSYFQNVEGFGNGGWGLGTDSIGSVSAASINFSLLNFYGNTDGACWNAGSLVGQELTCTGITGNGITLNPWGLYIAPTGGGSIISSANLATGTVPFEVNAVNNHIYGNMNGDCGSVACVKVSGGYGNEFRFDGAITAGHLYAVYGESANNHFFSHVATAGTSDLYDTAHAPGVNDFVDLTSNQPEASELWQERRQATWSTSTPHTGTITTGAASTAVVGVSTAFTTAMIGGTVTVGGNSCIISAVADTTHLTCATNFGANNAGAAYTITNVPLVLTNNTSPIPNMTTHWPLFTASGAMTTNAIENYGVITLDGATPSSGTATFIHPFTGAGTYYCTLGLIKASAVTYSPGWSNTSASVITLKGANTATDQWAYRCAGY